MENSIVIYGAYGYTGRLIVEEAMKFQLKPVLSGRNPEKLKTLAEETGLECVPFEIGDHARAQEVLSGARILLNCAGPFIHTAGFMAEQCIQTGTHYLDITGEILVFEQMASFSARAAERDVILLPGVGFDVVPTDCLARRLKERLPEADKLQLAFMGLGRTSRGTALTAIEHMHRGGAVRKNGVIVPVPPAWKSMEVDFGPFRKLAITIPWGDVSTAWYSTGIPDIEVYTVLPAQAVKLMKWAKYFNPLFRMDFIKNILRKKIMKMPPGPSPEERKSGKSYIWGRVVDSKNKKYAEARMETPEGYTLTARTAVEAIRRILEGKVNGKGFLTPSLAFGSGFIFEIEGVNLIDESSGTLE